MLHRAVEKAATNKVDRRAVWPKKFKKMSQIEHSLRVFHCCKQTTDCRNIGLVWTGASPPPPPFSSCTLRKTAQKYKSEFKSNPPMPLVTGIAHIHLSCHSGYMKNIYALIYANFGNEQRQLIMNAYYSWN